jgi:hypothetical protein
MYRERNSSGATIPVSLGHHHPMPRCCQWRFQTVLRQSGARQPEFLPSDLSSGDGAHIPKQSQRAIHRTIAVAPRERRERRCLRTSRARSRAWSLAWLRTGSFHGGARSIHERKLRFSCLEAQCPDALQDPCDAVESGCQFDATRYEVGFQAWCLDGEWRPSSLSVLPDRLHQSRDLSS